MTWEEIPVPEPMKYVDGALLVKDHAPIVGQVCIKNIDYMVQKEIKAVRLV